MAEIGQELMLRDGAVGTKRGQPVYLTNPSIPQNGIQTRTKRTMIPGGKATVISDHQTGEILGRGGMGFWYDEEVDQGRFVKIFLDGIKQAAGLSKAGMQVFEFVYNQVRDAPSKDEIKLNFYEANLFKKDLTDRTYRRGVKELLDKEFLYRSPTDGVYFVNIRYMFNGNRLAFVKTYHLKNPPGWATSPARWAPTG
jgi:hypothetical protein